MSVLRAGSRLVLMMVGTMLCSAQRYFPDGALGASPREHEFVADWYTKQLRALGEDPLPRNAKVHRFLWLRTFHHPIAIMVSHLSDGTGRLTVKEADGNGGYQPGKVIRNQQRALSRESMREIVASAGRIAFVKSAGSGCDGSQWVVEIVGPQGYRVTDVWSPLPQDPVYRYGTLLLRLAGLKIADRELY